MCSRCGGKGFIDSYFGGGGTYTSQARFCPERCNDSGYYAEVRRRLNDPSYATAHMVMKIPPAQPRRHLKAVEDVDA